MIRQLNLEGNYESGGKNGTTVSSSIGVSALPCDRCEWHPRFLHHAREPLNAKPMPSPDRGPVSDERPPNETRPVEKPRVTTENDQDRARSIVRIEWEAKNRMIVFLS